MAAAAPDSPQPCALCGRAGPTLTKHHLIPRAVHDRKWARRRFGRAEMQARVLWVCRSCHRHIHATLPEKDLAHHYNTREALLGHAEIARFAAWIADKPPGLAIRSRDRRR